MNKKNRINEKWIKASIVGTVWAASEIVLGSFLHNLKIPFSSNLLTAIGVITLISISYVWTERGLFWRAGLICAVMKTMSPSAVIFGPMIAIFSQAVLLDISVRIFGKNWFGYLLGAILAMTWNLFHKIANFIIFYGFNIVDLYTDLLKYAQKQMNLHFEIVWLPILILLFISCILGIIAGIIGIKVGRKLLDHPNKNVAFESQKPLIKKQDETKIAFNYSLLWLILNIIFISSALILLNLTSWMFWIIGISIIVLFWIFRYKRALRQLLKPRFWFSFIIITMLTSIVFSKIQSYSFRQAMLIGIQMNFRAIIVILGFSVMGTELYNPKIRKFFANSHFKQLTYALELSFDSLPSMIKNVPSAKELFKNPVSIIYSIISQAEMRLQEINNSLSKKVFILTGKVEQGKTSQLIKIINNLKENHISIGGIYSPRIIENNITIGYNIVEISRQESVIFLQKNNKNENEKIGNYSILTDGLQFGLNSIADAKNSKKKIIVIDEVGKLELEDKGWSNEISDILNNFESNLLITIRDCYTFQVIKKWNIKDYIIFNVNEQNSLEVSNLIMEKI